MGAGKALDIHTDDWNNRGGIAQGETAVTATAGNLNNDGGKLLSGQTSTLKTRATLPTAAVKSAPRC